MISDGFGDQLTFLEDELDRIFQDFGGWLFSVSTRLLRDVRHEDHDDLVQEGRIAIWRGLRERPELTEHAGYITSCAYWHMSEVMTRKHWTGQPARLNGRTPVSELFPTTTPVFLDSLLDGVSGVEEMLSAADVIASADWAYHRGEIAQALATLAPAQRRYVYARFWLGYEGQPGAMKGLFGYDPHGLWTSPKNGARQKLQRKLEHLAVTR